MADGAAATAAAACEEEEDLHAHARRGRSEELPRLAAGTMVAAGGCGCGGGLLGVVTWGEMSGGGADAGGKEGRRGGGGRYTLMNDGLW